MGVEVGVTESAAVVAGLSTGVDEVEAVALPPGERENVPPPLSCGDRTFRMKPAALLSEDAVGLCTGMPMNPGM